jgi:hypothetical protein
LTAAGHETREQHAAAPVRQAPTREQDGAIVVALERLAERHGEALRLAHEVAARGLRGIARGPGGERAFVEEEGFLGHPPVAPGDTQHAGALLGHRAVILDQRFLCFRIQHSEMDGRELLGHAAREPARAAGEECYECQRESARRIMGPIFKSPG